MPSPTSAYHFILWLGQWMGYKLLKWHIFQSPLHPAYVLRCGVVCALVRCGVCPCVVCADYGSCHMSTRTQMMPLVAFVDLPTTPEEKEPTISSPPTTSLDLKQSQGSAAFQPKKYEMKAYILDVDQY